MSKKYKGAREGYDPRDLPGGGNKPFVQTHKLTPEERRERRVRNRIRRWTHLNFRKRNKHGRQ